MKIAIYDTYDEMSKAAAELVAKQLAEKPASVLCFPSGDSPTGTLNFIAQWANEGRIDLSQCFFIGLDEWVGMDENDAGSCKYYLKHNFFDKLNTKLTNVTLFDAKAADLELECERINNFISSKGGHEWPPGIERTLHTVSPLCPPLTVGPYYRTGGSKIF
jgi:6-phosphogluconolactonase/glucosamine-6-phosphate isomerase/deaminase